MVQMNTVSRGYQTIVQMVVYVKNVYKAIVLRFFTSQATFKKFDKETIRNFSAVELKFLTSGQVKLIGISRFSTEQIKVLPKEFASFSVKQKVKTNQNEHVDPITTLFKEVRGCPKEREKEMFEKLLKEPEENLISIVKMAETEKTYMVTTLLIKAYLKENRSLTNLSSHMTKECFEGVVGEMSGSPTIRQLSLASQDFDPAAKKRFHEVEGVTRHLRRSLSGAINLSQNNDVIQKENVDRLDRLFDEAVKSVDENEPPILKKLAKEPDVNLIYLVNKANKGKLAVIILLVKALLTNNRSIAKICSYMSQESVNTLVVCMYASPLLRKQFMEAFKSFDEETKTRFMKTPKMSRILSRSSRAHQMRLSHQHSFSEVV